MNLGNNLKHLRKGKGVTQIKLAEDLSVDKSTVACYETNRNEPNIEMLKRLAKYFDVTLDELLED